ncbi:hypothetical protein [Chitinimonas lacunae]|uniref:Uncharacterized protein n=1 Tax=Chitinimonas lacunae TaxID=1963018 RepID=A0ABV8MJH5_9NEIS
MSKALTLAAVCCLTAGGCSTTQPLPASCPQMPTPSASLRVAPEELTRLPAGPVDDAVALAVVAENYGQCRIWRDRLIGWQSWHRAISRE